MIVNMSAKLLALLLAIGAASTTGSNLRRRAIILGHVDVGKILGHVNVGKNIASTATQQNVASTTGSNLRRRATLFDQGHDGSNNNKAASTATAEEFKGSIISNKLAYEYDETVSINFALPLSSSTIQIKEDLSNYKIGIFMRMANTQGGSLEPVVALPLCSNVGSSSCTKSESKGRTTGSVTFNYDSMMQMMPTGAWPINLYQWGTGFDVYVLDENGADVVGPYQFNILMNETS